jgi:hypothetical protein
MKQEAGFVWLFVLPVLALLAFGIHQLVHHNEPNSDHLIAAYEEQGGCRTAGCAAPVPEPASGLLVAAGGLVVGYAVRRKLT